jgi:hypothetical protein
LPIKLIKPSKFWKSFLFRYYLEHQRRREKKFRGEWAKMLLKLKLFFYNRSKPIGNIKISTPANPISYLAKPVKDI